VQFATGVAVDLVEKKIVGENVVFGADDTNVKQGWLPSRAVFGEWSKQDTGPQKYAEQAR
jgi:hypothetical protein